MADITADGKTKVSWVPTISNTAAPTTAELNAGVALEGFITADGLGLSFSQGEVDTTGLASTVDTKLPGRRGIDGDLTLKSQGRGAAPYTTFAGTPDGYLVVRRSEAASNAWASDDLVEVYTCQAGRRRPVAPAADGTAQFMVALRHTAADVAATVA